MEETRSRFAAIIAPSYSLSRSRHGAEVDYFAQQILEGW